MTTATPSQPSVRIGIIGHPDITRENRSFALWPSGYSGAIRASNAEPVFLPPMTDDFNGPEYLEGIDGVVFANQHPAFPRQVASEELLCRWCREQGVPVLGIDLGMHAINGAFGGTLYLDLPRELPDALQHRHPPERGLRHAINVIKDTRLARLYGEGEVVVNSEHRVGIKRLARGFIASAVALDGVVEAIEPENPNWFALGVQWHPASLSASGLDIQVFRGLIDACVARVKQQTEPQLCRMAA
jgi:putative glutamine amidotransferase